MGIQGIPRTKGTCTYAPLFIDKQQTLDSFSNIVYVSATLNNENFAFNQVKILPVGQYKLVLKDNNTLPYLFEFTVTN